MNLFVLWTKVTPLPRHIWANKHKVFKIHQKDIVVALYNGM